MVADMGAQPAPSADAVLESHTHQDAARTGPEGEDRRERRSRDRYGRDRRERGDASRAMNRRASMPAAPEAEAVDSREAVDDRAGAATALSDRLRDRRSGSPLPRPGPQAAPSGAP